MDSFRHRTQKRSSTESSNNSDKEDAFKTLLEDSAREAYSRPWHRLERGLRLNRIRLYIEELVPQHNMSKEEKEAFFIYLQKALDKKLLNTLKVVQYEQDTQRIQTIKGLEVKRNAEGVIRWGFSAKKSRTDVTRKKKKEDTSHTQQNSLDLKIESNDVID